MKRKHNRKAISPVLATVILIAITLIAAIAIAGFVFGLFGTFTSTAQVSASVATCNSAQHWCQVSLTNNGNSNTQASGCSYNGAGGGAGVLGAVGANPVVSTAPIAIAAGQTVTAFCGQASNPSTAGSSVAGQILLTNGGSALFSGTWQ